MRNARCDFVSLSKSSWFPIWLAQAGAYLSGLGHTTKLLDAQVSGLTRAETYQIFRDFRPDLTVIYSGRLSEDSDVEFADQLAKDGSPLLFVGPYASINPQALLTKSKFAKGVVQKEFELPLREFLDGYALNTIKNLHFRADDGTVISNELRPLYRTEILDQFPPTSPYFHQQLRIEDYKTPSELYPFIDVMSGRGCAWGRCNFCLWVQTFVNGSVYNQRSIQHFMEEFRYLRDHVSQIRGVMIQDDMLTNKRATEISEALLHEGIKLRWSCYAKPNSKLSQETLNLMAKSGCLNLHVGFESGDDEVLKNIDKGSTVEDAKVFAEMAHKAGLQIHGDFAFGHFGETRESMMRTLDLARAINPHTAQFQIMIPFKGTKFWEQLEGASAFDSNGEPSYEASGGVTSDEVRAFAKFAYRKFYFSPAYFRKILANPRDYFFNRFDQYVRALPAVTWKHWDK
jgi:radical SAM superfamily enzyme YgiQ (UPF0313 family)